MTSLAAIHVAKKQLGLDDETYRAVLVRVTGKESSKGMSEGERGKVLEEFRRLGFSNAPASGSPQGGRAPREPRRKLEGKYAPKLQALWIAAWNLGITRSRDDKALVAFVKRQTGIDHVRFVRDPDDAAKAIEALKGWMAREAGVDWAAKLKRDGQRIAEAQHALLPMEGSFRDCVLDMTGKAFVQDIDGAGWIKVMNALGEKIRAMKGAA